MIIVKNSITSWHPSNFNEHRILWFVVAIFSQGLPVLMWKNKFSPIGCRKIRIGILEFSWCGNSKACYPIGLAILWRYFSIVVSADVNIQMLATPDRYIVITSPVGLIVVKDNVASGQQTGINLFGRFTAFAGEESIHRIWIHWSCLPVYGKSPNVY